ncbi:MAG: YdeI/OmpD-associated family protein [Myxococcaceae bacterium]|nr:YdeI/OmpD-associated family protein [Myxococcaceae bacterium]
MRAGNLEVPTLRPRDAKAWRAWLARHHASHRGVFLLIAKKHLLERRPTLLSYPQALDEALCFGWIDGLVRRFDDDWRAIRFTPRREDSIWSELNKGHVARLVREGRMTSAGLRLVELAKRNGEWAAARRRDALESPADLVAALKGRPRAATFWATLPPSHRKQWLYWVTEAKRPETRSRRVAAVVRECAASRRPGQQTPTTSATRPGRRRERS